MDAELRRLVWNRASGRCEYCRMRQQFDEVTFQIEHVTPRKHHGADHPNNLALACFACNNHKGTNLSGLDPVTGQMTRLFHPRRDHWDEHFHWQQATLIGRTPIGRTTIDVLAMNLPYRIELRMALIEEGVFH
ncbi:MAG: HNH endonuclease [Verrucomicrobia bacterium]|nr:HNH endonuclease [Verrucomicrobiota bacterium]